MDVRECADRFLWWNVCCCFYRCVVRIRHGPNDELRNSVFVWGYVSALVTFTAREIC